MIKELKNLLILKMQVNVSLAYTLMEEFVIFFGIKIIMEKLSKRIKSNKKREFLRHLETLKKPHLNT